MLGSQFILPMHDELVVDLFAGGGGTEACLGMMILTGHIASGMAWGFYMLCADIAYEGVKKHRAGPSAAPAA